MISADLVWPALILESRLAAPWIILLGLVVEYLVLRFGLGMNICMAIKANILMNFVSSVAGYFLVPLAGLIWEIVPGVFLRALLGIGTFSSVTWFSTLLFASLVNTLIESTVLRLVFQVVLSKKVFYCLYLGNFVTVGMALGSLAWIPYQG